MTIAGAMSQGTSMWYVVVQDDSHGFQFVSGEEPMELALGTLAVLVMSC